MNNTTSSRIETRTCGRGRAVYVHSDGVLYVGRNYRVYRSADDGQTWARITEIPRAFSRRLVETSRLACRLLRHEVRALVALSDGTLVASTRAGLYRAGPGEGQMVPSWVCCDGDALMPPMCLTCGPDDRILGGEYGMNPDRRQIRLYVSEDGGRNFEVGHVFPPGLIRHVHNITYDAQRRHYWVLTGDFDGEAGIARLSADLKDFDWLVRGRQEYRAVCVFDCGEHLVYGTDSELEPNAIMRVHKETGASVRICELPGSCIYACRFGEIYALSTSVEPSKVNLAREATLWVSRDGDRWTQAFQAAADRWAGKYFQYGSLLLPRGESDREVILFSGRGLRGLDNRVIAARWSPSTPSAAHSPTP
ncbi:MAG: hypothetical protein GY842_06050 [bacterium]|nr:hypothetical protein [bacterium]